MRTCLALTYSSWSRTQASFLLLYIREVDQCLLLFEICVTRSIGTPDQYTCRYRILQLTLQLFFLALGPRPAKRLAAISRARGVSAMAAYPALKAPQHTRPYNLEVEVLQLVQQRGTHKAPVVARPPAAPACMHMHASAHGLYLALAVSPESVQVTS